VGAPAVAKKRIASEKWRKSARKEFDAWVTEGERLTGQVRDAKVVDDIKEKVDFDQLQGRVEKLRDQLEDVLSNWKATFKPEEKQEAKKPAAKKTTAKKAAAKKTTAKKAAAKKTTAKKSPAKTSA
jgi:hypothetical protein